MEAGFLPNLVGGLGNQIFIVVAAWVTAKVHNCPVYLPKQNPKKNPHSSTDYTRSLFKEFGVLLDWTEDEAKTNLNYSSWEKPGFAPWSPSQPKPGQILCSYFQYYPPLAAFEEEIRRKLLKGLPSVEPMPDAAFLHIRRGDYLRLSNVHFVQTMDYYTKALDELSKRGCYERLFIFSDDISWAKDQNWSVDDYVQIEFVEKNEIESLALMAACQAGAICGNSTFSWWGAFLGTYGVRNPVFVPSRWINDPIYFLFPPEWVVIA